MIRGYKICSSIICQSSWPGHLGVISEGCYIFLLSRGPDERVKEVKFLLPGYAMGNAVGLEIVKELIQRMDVPITAMECGWFVHLVQR